MLGVAPAITDKPRSTGIPFPLERSRKAGEESASRRPTGSPRNGRSAVDVAVALDDELAGRGVGVDELRRQRDPYGNVKMTANPMTEG